MYHRDHHFIPQPHIRVPELFDIPTVGNAYHVAYQPTETRNAEHWYDRHVDRVTDSEESNSWRFANVFYRDNQTAIEGAVVNIASMDVDKHVEVAINGFTETARVMIKGLDALAQVHPFIGVAVVAFKLVVTLDMSRRENNKKVVAIKVDMQDMMSVLFQLRHMKDPNEIGPDGLALKDRFHDLMEKIAKDVTECGSACDVYMKKSFLSKMIKSKIYEERLAAYATVFETNRAALVRALAVNSALGVDEANIKLDWHGRQLDLVEDKVNKVLDLFRKLESPREHSIQEFIEKNDGGKACINDDSLLIKLLEQGGEPLPTDPKIGKRADDLKAAREKLLKELSEDIDEAIKKNQALFERKLEMQKKQLENAIHEEGDRVITTLSSGAHDRILYRDIRRIWKNMGWKGSVKARHFVLALHDYYAEKFATAPQMLQMDAPVIPSLGYTGPLPLTSSEVGDQWVLAYLNVSHVQPILEEIDDDGTGFITIKEVNTFTRLRPHRWTFLQWFAYWAAGWHLSVSEYKNRIYALVQQIFGLVKAVLPVNKRTVDTSLRVPCFLKLERLLRSTHSVSSAVLTDPELARHTKRYNEYEESRLDAQLQSVGYELDTAATVTLVTGPGRIDRYVYPLLFLLLRHRVKLMKLASIHVLHPGEFSVSNQSMTSIMQAVDERIEVLAAVFKQTHSDVRTRLGNVAFGMFQLVFDGVERNPSTYSFLDWKDAPEKPVGDDIDADEIPLSILKYDVEDVFEYEEYVTPQPPTGSDARISINGLWAGHCYICNSGDFSSSQGLLQITIDSTPGESSLTGNGESHAGLPSVIGIVDETGADGTKIILMLSYRDNLTIRCNGIFDPRADTIRGEWSVVGSKDDVDPASPGSNANEESDGSEEKDQNATNDDHDDDRGNDVDTTPPATMSIRTFEFTRTPSHLYRFRYKIGTPPTAKSRWLFACSAIRRQVQKQLWSWGHIQAHCRERRRFMNLIIRDLIHRENYTPFQPLSQSEYVELGKLKQNICPSDARLCLLCVDLQVQKLPHHPWIYCDACGRKITQTRVICATCTSADLSDNIDLCLTCMYQTPSRGAFSHQISHLLVKTDRVLHDYSLASTIRAANANAGRVKSNLRDLQKNPECHTGIDTHETSHDIRPTPGMLCSCCGEVVATRFWVCVECAADIYICHDCSSKKNPALLDSNHEINHILAQVYDEKDIVEVDAVDLRFQSMERRMTELESKVQWRLESLESTISARLTAFEEVLQRLATQITMLAQRP